MANPAKKADDSEQLKVLLTQLEKEWLRYKEAEMEAQEIRRGIETQMITLAPELATPGTHKLTAIKSTTAVERKLNQVLVAKLISEEPCLLHTAFKPEYKADKRKMDAVLEAGGSLAKKLRPCFTDELRKPSFSKL